MRVDRTVENTQALAEWLAQHPAVEQVNYPGLPSSPYYALGQRYFRRGVGGVFTFRLRGDAASAARFVDSLKLVSHLANVGDSKTLIIHPASTTHQQLTADEQLAAGVHPTDLRVSVGIEHIDDIKADFQQAFDTVVKPQPVHA